MEILKKRSIWLIYLAIAGGLVVIISALYSQILAKRLAEHERQKVEIFAITLSSMSLDERPDLDEDVTQQVAILETIKDIPLILVGENSQVEKGVNFGSKRNNDIIFLEKELEKIKKRGSPPITGYQGYANEIYYKNTRWVTLLTYFPFIQFLMLLTFVLVGYIMLNSARRAEQNQVWVGMAKETAHQLGTPISAIMAWIEHLKEGTFGDNSEEQREILYELGNDVDRLNLIADRFSKIGSAPKMEKINVFEELEKCRTYMQKRASRKIEFIFPETSQEPLFVMMNPPLFDWVVENLLRNALDAMGDSGTISVDVEQDGKFANISISDTGKGIPSSKFKTVFRPGYTTKPRGWGLGLSLARRIIENYHSGRIYVKRSSEEGTTFAIKLPQGGSS